MGPSKRKAARKAKPKAGARARPPRKPARRKAASARKPVAPPLGPPEPKPWSAEVAGLNLAWYTVTDWERAKRFYGETLGFPVAYANDTPDMGWIEYGTGLPRLAIARGKPYEFVPSSGGAVAVLTCPDVRATMARLQAAGVRCGDIDEIPGMVVLGTFFDPDGNRIQLAQSLVK